MVIQALILAAGEGQRMRPLTENQPKPLIKVNGISMLDRILAKLDKIPQIQKIVINGFYLSDKIEDHLKSINNKKITFSREIQKLETGGGLLQAMQFFDENEPILIINGDIIWQNFDVIQFMIENFDSKNTDILLGLKAKHSFLGYNGNGDFNLRDGKMITDKINDFVYTGIQILHPRILKQQKLPKPPFSLNYFFTDLIPDPDFSLSADYLKMGFGISQKLIRIKGVELKGDFFHIGTAEDLAKYEKNII